jgi:hypothetical protein
MFTEANHWSLSLVAWSSPYHLMYVSVLIFHLCLGLPSDLFPSGFLTKILYPFLISRMRAMNSVHLILLNLITPILVEPILWKEKIMKLVRWSSQQDEMVGHVTCVGDMRNEDKILVGIPEGKGSLRRPMRSLCGRIELKCLLNTIWFERVSSDSIGASSGSCAHGNELPVSTKMENFLISWATNSFSRRTLLHGVSLSFYLHTVFTSFTRVSLSIKM